MDARSYFIAAIKANAHLHKRWIITAFTVCRAPVFNDRPIEYPYELFRKAADSTDLYFMNPVDQTLVRVECEPNRPIFTLSDELDLTPDDFVNVRKPIKTCYGNALLNAIVLVYPFGNKFEFINSRFKGSAIEAMVAARLRDTPPPDTKRDPTLVYVDEYLLFAKALSSLAGLAQINVPAASPKSVGIDPAILKRRDELFKEHAANITDPAVIAGIEKELTDMDKASLKGDPSEGFYIKDKSYRVARKRMLIMYGAEAGFSTSKGNNVPIKRALRDGWDIHHLPAMVDTARQGSYGRGAMTALGGESVKYFYRVFQNTKIAEMDCSSAGGWWWEIDKHNVRQFIGLYAPGKGVEAFTSDTLNGLIGKRILVRSPQFCQTAKPSFCAKCAGELMAMTPTAVQSACSGVGSAMMLKSMAAMHGVALEVVPVELDEAFG